MALRYRLEYTETMMTPKEALAKDGTIEVKLGRGRMPAGGHDRCQWLVDNEGYSIKGYVKSGNTSSSTAEPVKPKRIPANGNLENYADVVYTYPETSHKAVGPNGEVYGMRECCNTCRVSLVQCHCGHPTILGNIPITIALK